MRENGAEIAKAGVAVFAASVDDAATNKKFADSIWGSTTRSSPIPPRRRPKAYGVLNPANGLAMRWTFFIGKDGRIAGIDEAVQPTTHGKSVADQAMKLGLSK